MIQLSYQPALDPFNAAYRFLRLRSVFDLGDVVHINHFRILDFYLLFPFRIGEIRLAPKHQKFKKLAGKFSHKKPYGPMPESSEIFVRMQPMQTAALGTIAAWKLIDAEAFARKEVRITGEALPNPVDSRILEQNENEADLMEFMRVLAKEYVLEGASGLKARTQLMEYRYDAL
jgi:hypothetical protein